MKHLGFLGREQGFKPLHGPSKGDVRPPTSNWNMVPPIMPWIVRIDFNTLKGNKRKLRTYMNHLGMLVLGNVKQVLLLRWKTWSQCVGLRRSTC